LPILISVQLCYTLLSRAFQLPFDRAFGKAGFVLVWMINFLGMLSMGLALESMLTILTVRFVGFFLIPWVVTNISSVVLPIDTQQSALYKFGHGMPFYNVSRAVRAIIFGTKNDRKLSVFSTCCPCLFKFWGYSRIELWCLNCLDSFVLFDTLFVPSIFEKESSYGCYRGV
jgi:hypothetical protein